MTGGNTWVPAAIEYLDDLDRLVVGGGLTAGELTALAEGAMRSEANLSVSASLSVDDDTLKIVNLTGHKLISGYPEGRRMWVNVKWYDGELLLREDGAYGDLTVDIDGIPTVVRTLLDPHDVNTTVYEAHHGMSQEWAALLVSLGWSTDLELGYDRVTGAVEMTLGELAESGLGTVQETFHFALNDTMIRDNRIPPYGFSFDAAVQRNILPVPADQYGDPGAGEVYEYYAELALLPPTGATHADIDLLYQTTSWEYVRFLAEANLGSVEFLADTGADLLEAWQATGMSEPVVMASTSWTGAVNAWSDLGHALAGTNGLPQLAAEGTLLPDTALSLVLTNGLEGTLAYLVVGYSALNAPLYGGVLVPDLSPPGFFVTLFTDGSGSIPIHETWPQGVPSGFSLFLQYWLEDPAGPEGFSASNGVVGTTP